MGRIQKHQDPVAVVLSSVVGILGSVGLIDRLGLTADQVAQVLGFTLAIVAAVRTIFQRRMVNELEELRASKASPPPSAMETVEGDTTDRLD